MRVLRAEHLGMCFGVRDAIALAFDARRSPRRSRSSAISFTTKPCWPACRPRGLPLPAIRLK